MKRKRLGKDLQIRWSIVNRDQPFMIEGLDITLYLKGPVTKTKIEDFTLIDNRICWVFLGKRQKHPGIYSLELVINEGKEGMTTTDACSFVELTDCSCKEGGISASTIEIESLDLTSVIEFNYDDSSIKKELAKKADKGDVPTKMSQLEQDVELGTDSPIVKGEAENSAVLKGGNNQAISELSVSLGENNIAGLKGWYYKAVQIGSDSKIVYLYLSTKQQTPIIVSSASAVENQEKTIEVNLSKGDICSIINGDRQLDNFEFRLNEMSNYGRISFTYKGTGVNPLYTIKDVEELKLEDYSIFCLSKPNEGLVELSKYNIALGNNTKSLSETSVSMGLRSIAAGITSYAEGQDTIAIGECSHAEGAFTKSKGIASHTEGFNTQTEGLSAHAEGYNTLATGGASHAEGSATKATGLHSHSEGDTTVALGDQSHAEGKQTTASGDQSHAEGYGTIAEGYHLHAEGFYTRAFGDASHSEGYRTIANNKGEHAEGVYNKSTENVTLHSVGIGTSDNDRKNAHEITVDGKHYIYGIGNYVGKNTSSSTDLATYIKSLETRIKELEDIIEQITEKV